MKKGILCAVFSLCSANMAWAGQTTGPHSPGDTHWQLTPYLWAASMNASVSPFRRAPELGVKKSFSDIVDDLNVGGFINVWARHDRLVFSGDLMFTDTSNSEAKGPLPAMQLPGLGVTIPPGASTTAYLDSRQLSATLLGGYRLVDDDKITVDMLAGARFWYISNRISVNASHPLIGTHQGDHKESFGWVDPLIGARLQLRADDRLSLLVQADAGGYTGQADDTWSLLAAAHYQLPSQFSVIAGYKVISVNYNHDNYVYHTRLGGPAIGLSYRF
ncbi:hypothetical protein LL240_07115 [Oceanimonas baumannii]|uniref:hypothetical protein n=1 Tax=Oceanimonas baumannii TaxID=129578 RepID=UPI001D17DC61|nr:hypothetical protein [Oceanimonas baumannii]MCC4264223.1 hypothetical protein [Oceanimonas baumannii]